MKLQFPLKMQYLYKEVAIWRGKTLSRQCYSVGNLQLENHVMCNAPQFCHDSGCACKEECFFYQASEDLKQLLGDGGTGSSGKGQSFAYWAGCGSSPSSDPEFYFGLWRNL